MLPAMPGATLVVGNPLGDVSHRIYNVSRTTSAPRRSPPRARARSLPKLPHLELARRVHARQWYARTAQGELDGAAPAPTRRCCTARPMTADARRHLPVRVVGRNRRPGIRCAPCATPTTSPAARWTATRRWWAVSPRTSGRYVVTAQLPVGPIANVIVSDCPWRTPAR